MTEEDDQNAWLLLHSILKRFSFQHMFVAAVVICVSLIVAKITSWLFSTLFRFIFRIKDQKHIEGTKYTIQEQCHSGCKETIYVPSNVQWQSTHCGTGLNFRITANRICLVSRIIKFIIWLGGASIAGLMVGFSLFGTLQGFGLLSVFIYSTMDIIVRPLVSGLFILGFEEIQKGYIIQQGASYWKVMSLGITHVRVIDITLLVKEIEKNIYAHCQPKKKNISNDNPIGKYTRSKRKHCIEVDTEDRFFESIPLFKELSIPNTSLVTITTTHLLSRD